MKSCSQNRKGEIVVCAYSLDQEDSIVRDWPNRRDFGKVEKWLKEEDHDFRFTILTGDKYRFQGSALNLTEAAPELVLEVLTEPYSKFRSTQTVKLYFDGGGFHHQQKESLREYFRDLGTEIVVNNFIKKNKNMRGKIRKGPHCPKLVHFADILASHLDSLPAGELLSHLKFIP